MQRTGIIPTVDLELAVAHYCDDMSNAAGAGEGRDGAAGRCLTHDHACRSDRMYR